MEEIIEFKNIKKAYGEKVVMENFNLTIKKGEFITIIGSSGGGKTTIMKMVNGLITPTFGDVFVEGKNIKELNQNELRRNIGYAIQGSVLFPHMTVEENISYVPNLLNKRDKERTRRAVAKWMKIVDLDEDMLHRYPAELSGGQQQRVGIARALAASPEILLMDEPFGALDAITRYKLQDDLLHITKSQNKTVIFVTHDIDEAVFLADKIVVMSPNPGRIKAVIPIGLGSHRDRTGGDFLQLRDKVFRIFNMKEEDNTEYYI